MDPYAPLSRYYDLENAGLTEDLGFYRALAAAAPDGPVLDIGCGTGRVTLELAEAGRAVVGLDSSPAMLARARERLARRPELAARVSWQAGDVTRLARRERFALAVWAYNGFMHLTAPAAQRAALRQVADHLLPGACLAVDLPNPAEPYAADHNGALTLERVFDDPGEGARVLQQASTLLDRSAQLLHVTWVYDAVYPDGRQQRTVVPLTLRYTFPAELALLLELAGLRLAGLYGDYDRAPFEESSPRLLAVAERPA